MSEPEMQTDPRTGGQKFQKDVQLSMAPVAFLEDLGRVYAMGAKKYTRDNWRKGYDWHLSYDAALRHLLRSMAGEDLDPESGIPHVVHVAWHMATLHTFRRAGLGTDDRTPEGAGADGSGSGSGQLRESRPDPDTSWAPEEWFLHEG